MLLGSHCISNSIIRVHALEWQNFQKGRWWAQKSKLPVRIWRFFFLSWIQKEFIDSKTNTNQHQDSNKSNTNNNWEGCNSNIFFWHQHNFLICYWTLFATMRIFHGASISSVTIFQILKNILKNFLGDFHFFCWTVTDLIATYHEFNSGATGNLSVGQFPHIGRFGIGIGQTCKFSLTLGWSNCWNCRGILDIQLVFFAERKF